MKKLSSVSIVIVTHDRQTQLLRLLESLNRSQVKPLEVIIVDNSGNLSKSNIELSTLDFSKNQKQTTTNNLFPNYQLISFSCNLGLAAGRNAGAKNAKGDYVLFIDDDNVIGPGMIGALQSAMDKDITLAGCGPLTFYLNDPEKIWFASVRMSLTTTIPRFFRPTTSCQLPTAIGTDNLHNCFMVRKALGDKAGWFDDFMFMGGTEYDLFLRIRKIFPEGKLATVTAAKCWHDVPTTSGNLIRSLGFESPLRVYYFQRNRGLLVGRYGNIWQKILLLTFFYPFFLVVYGTLFLCSDAKMLTQHLKGTVDGYKLLIKGFFPANRKAILKGDSPA